MELCQHIYDEQGCYWVCDLIFWTFCPLTDCQNNKNMPANYDPGVFENCDGEDE